MGASKGFRIRASVVDTTQSPDASKTWAEYYAPCEDFFIFVENEIPVIGPGVVSTNEIPLFPFLTFDSVLYFQKSAKIISE